MGLQCFIIVLLDGPLEKNQTDGSYSRNGGALISMMNTV